MLVLNQSAEYSTSVLSVQASANMPAEHQDTATRQRPGTATYEKGRATATAILETARKIVIDEGMHALSMRRIARDMGLSPGNLSYYYASKSDLISDLLNMVINEYMAEFERLRNLQAHSPQAQLRDVLNFIYDDLAAKETTYFFPELWTLALRHDWAEAHMMRIYGVYQDVLSEIVSAMRPELPPQSAKDISLAISASLEGLTVFIGHKRAHAERAPFVKPLIIEQLISLARDGACTAQQPAHSANKVGHIRSHIQGM